MIQDPKPLWIYWTGCGDQGKCALTIHSSQHRFAARLTSGAKPLINLPAKRSKFEKLLAVYERFGQEIASTPDPWAIKLAKQSSALRTNTATVLSKEPGPSKGQLAAGLEQGLRDTPDFIALVAPEWRAKVATALNSAIQSEYPEFLSRDAERLEKIRARGKIRTESEYYLVRHRIDVLEGDDPGALLQELYLLIDAYGAKIQ